MSKKSEPKPPAWHFDGDYPAADFDGGGVGTLAATVTLRAGEDVLASVRAQADAFLEDRYGEALKAVFHGSQPYAAWKALNDKVDAVRADLAHLEVERAKLHERWEAALTSLEPGEGYSQGLVEVDDEQEALDKRIGATQRALDGLATHLAAAHAKAAEELEGAALAVRDALRAEAKERKTAALAGLEAAASDALTSLAAATRCCEATGLDGALAALRRGLLPPAA